MRLDYLIARMKQVQRTAGYDEITYLGEMESRQEIENCKTVLSLLIDMLSVFQKPADEMGLKELLPFSEDSLNVHNFSFTTSRAAHIAPIGAIIKGRSVVHSRQIVPDENITQPPLMRIDKAWLRRISDQLIN